MEIAWMIWSLLMALLICATYAFCLVVVTLAILTVIIGIIFGVWLCVDTLAHNHTKRVGYRHKYKSNKMNKL